jgi:hypothetical protein
MVQKKDYQGEYTLCSCISELFEKLELAFIGLSQDTLSVCTGGLFPFLVMTHHAQSHDMHDQISNNHHIPSRASQHMVSEQAQATHTAAPPIWTISITGLVSSIFNAALHQDAHRHTSSV